MGENSIATIIQVTQTDLECAVAHPELRDDLLKLVNREWARQYIEGVYYLSDPATKGWKMATIPTFNSPANRKSNIYVSPDAFNQDIVVGEFLSTLIDHEGTHAKQFYEDPLLYTAHCNNGSFSLYRQTFGAIDTTEILGIIAFGPTRDTIDYQVLIDVYEMEIEAYERQIEVIRSNERHVSEKCFGDLENIVKIHRQNIANILPLVSMEHCN